MKISLKYLSIIAVSAFISSCGGAENGEKAASEEPKKAVSDLFADDRPEYDPLKIDPSAEIVEVNLNANGNTMAEMSYDTKEISVKSGTTVVLKFKNNSTDASMPHNWVLVLEGTMEAVATAGISIGKEGNYVPNSRDVLVSSKLLGPGEETTLTFPAPPSGTYQFVCTYPGHWSIMNGVFKVD